jgi:hypothetical protein
LAVAVRAGLVSVGRMCRRTRRRRTAVDAGGRRPCRPPSDQLARRRTARRCRAGDSLGRCRRGTDRPRRTSRRRPSRSPRRTLRRAARSARRGVWPRQGPPLRSGRQHNRQHAQASSGHRSLLSPSARSTLTHRRISCQRPYLVLRRLVPHDRESATCPRVARALEQSGRPAAGGRPLRRCPDRSDRLRARSG